MADNVKELAFKDYKAGMSLSGIAKKYDLKLDTVKKWKKRYWVDDVTEGQSKGARGQELGDKGTKNVTGSKVALSVVKTKANPADNLIPLNKRSKEAQREIQSAGGVASNKARREKVAAKEIAKMILAGDIPLNDTKTSAIRSMLQEMGLQETELNMQAALVAGQTLSGMRGNHQAAQLVLSLVGEDPLTQIKEREMEIREAEYAATNGETDNNVESYQGLPARALGREYFDIDRDIESRRYRRYDNKGGRGSLKSSYFGLKIVDQIMRHPHLCAMCVRQLVDDLRDSVYAQIVWAIDELGLTDQFKCTKSPMQITRKTTGQIIYFRGADNPSKIKSIKPPKGMHIGLLWFEEFDQINGLAAYRNILQSAFRGGDDGVVFCSYNTPISNKHWVNKDALETDPTRVIYHTSYKNAPKEWLGQAFLDLAEHTKSTNERAYKHEYGGEATGTGSNVFENVTIRKITDKEIAQFDNIYLGIDWGYFPDPAVFNAYYYHSASQKLYVFDEVTALKASNEKFAGLIVEKWKDTRIIADSAEPKSITDFKDLGFWIAGAKKGKGSVDSGMRWLSTRVEIIIDSARCPNAANEFSSYEYAQDKDGNVISGYIDKDNHSIDNARYAFEEIWRKERWEK